MATAPKSNHFASPEWLAETERTFHERRIVFDDGAFDGCFVIPVPEPPPPPPPAPGAIRIYEYRDLSRRRR